MTTSLVDRVHDSLARSKKELGAVFRSTFVAKVKDDVEAQRELNIYLRQQLSRAPVSTLDERGCLLDTIGPEMWFKYFESHVLPTLVRFDLPKE